MSITFILSLTNPLVFKLFIHTFRIICPRLFTGS
nr:MAG TPA: hypothetical protein [Caudoviricetes sp.]